MHGNSHDSANTFALMVVSCWLLVVWSQTTNNNHQPLGPSYLSLATSHESLVTSHQDPLAFSIQVWYNTFRRYAGVAEWQTQQTQNLPIAISCGFKSHLRHQKDWNLIKVSVFFISFIIAKGYYSANFYFLTYKKIPLTKGYQGYKWLWRRSYLHNHI